MKIRNRHNGGIAEVDEALADRMVATGDWTKATDTPKTATKKTSTKVTKLEED